jgi:hypothetical protein
MKVEEIPLVSPTGSTIVGFLTESGGTCQVICKFSRQNGENFFFFEVPPGMMDEVINKDGDRVFVDQNGEHWSTADVMWTSTPRVA